MVKKVTIQTDKAPKALGPYSVANRAGNFVFASGQLGLDPKTNEFVTGGIEAETHQSLTNLQHVLEAAGSALAHVVKTTVYLRDMQDFTRMNKVYNEFFTENFPARSTVQVAALPRNGAVEIDIIAIISE